MGMEGVEMDKMPSGRYDATTRRRVSKRVRLLVLQLFLPFVFARGGEKDWRKKGEARSRVPDQASRTRRVLQPTYDAPSKEVEKATPATRSKMSGVFRTIIYLFRRVSLLTTDADAMFVYKHSLFLFFYFLNFFFLFCAF